MGKIVNKRLTSSFSGQLGDDVVFRQVGNKTFFAKKGVNAKPPTPAQRGNRNLFATAQNYAAQMLEEPKYSEWYSIVAKVNGLRSAQIAAVKDFIGWPIILPSWDRLSATFTNVYIYILHVFKNRE